MLYQHGKGYLKYWSFKTWYGWLRFGKFPHAFIAGETGSGKSNVLKCMIYQSIVKNYEIIFIDFKRGVVFSKFHDISPIYYEHNNTLKVLKDIMNETKQRLDLLRGQGVKSLKDYNKLSSTPFKRKIIFIDELAELLSVRDKETSQLLYEYIETITRISRAVGVHLIMRIQRPDSTIINAQIKSNVSYRLCGHFVDREPSRIMLRNDQASTIENIKGRFIAKEDQLIEVQCFYYDDINFKPCKRDFGSVIDKDEVKKGHSNVETQQIKEDRENSSSKIDFNELNL